MGLAERFINFKRPDEFIFAGSNNLSVFRYYGKKWKLIYSNKSFSLKSINEDFVKIIGSEVNGKEVGVVIGSSEFIFNLLSFEKIPHKKKVRKDLIDWKIQKIFPDIIKNYHHEYFKLSSKLIFSVLISNEIKERIELGIEEAGKKNIYFGCSICEIINNLKLGKASPDFFIEYNSDQFTIVFLNKSNPFYIRKIRFINEEEGKEGILRTIEFVEKNYKRSIKSYSVIFTPGLYEDNSYLLKLPGVEMLNLHSTEFFLPK